MQKLHAKKHAIHDMCNPKWTWQSQTANLHAKTQSKDEVEDD